MQSRTESSASKKKLSAEKLLSLAEGLKQRKRLGWKPVFEPADGNDSGNEEEESNNGSSRLSFIYAKRKAVNAELDAKRRLDEEKINEAPDESRRGLNMVDTKVAGSLLPINNKKWNSEDRACPMLQPWSRDVAPKDVACKIAAGEVLLVQSSSEGNTRSAARDSVLKDLNLPKPQQLLPNKRNHCKDGAYSLTRPSVFDLENLQYPTHSSDNFSSGDPVEMFSQGERFPHLYIDLLKDNPLQPRISYAKGNMENEFNNPPHKKYVDTNMSANNLDLPPELCIPRLKSTDSGYHSSHGTLSFNSHLESLTSSSHLTTPHRHCICPSPEQESGACENFNQPSMNRVSPRGLGNVRGDDPGDSRPNRSLNLSLSKTNMGLQSFSDVFTDNSCSSVCQRTAEARPISENANREKRRGTENENSVSRGYQKRVARTITFSGPSGTKREAFESITNRRSDGTSLFLKSKNPIPLLLLPSKVLLQSAHTDSDTSTISEKPEAKIQARSSNSKGLFQGNGTSTAQTQLLASLRENAMTGEEVPKPSHCRSHELESKVCAQSDKKLMPSHTTTPSLLSREIRTGAVFKQQETNGVNVPLQRPPENSQAVQQPFDYGRASVLPRLSPERPLQPAINLHGILQESKKKTRTVIVSGEVYYKKKCIGAGGSAKVYEALDSSGQAFAVKVVQFADVEDEIARGYLNEVNLLCQMKGCPYVVQLHQYELRDEDLYLVMEKGDSDLSYILKAKKKLERSEILSYWSQMLHAVHAIHKAGIIHLDLKPSNFLLFRDTLKLIDFGIANKLHTDFTSITRHAQAGTINYMAPEQLSNSNDPTLKRLSPKTDVWSLACILYYMLYQTLPYKHIRSEHERVVAIKRGEVIRYPECEHQDLVEVLKSCLRFRAKERPSIEDLLQHPCFGKENGSPEKGFAALPKTPIRTFARQVTGCAINSPLAVAKIDKSIFRGRLNAPDEK